MQVTYDKNQLKKLTKLQNLKTVYTKAIDVGFVNVGNHLTRTVQRDFRKPKSGRIYKIKVNGQYIYHRASAPGEAPAILTGELSKSTKTKSCGHNRLKFMSGGEKAYYAPILEYYKNRPYMEKTVKENWGYFNMCFIALLRYGLVGRL
jgi:hypothetical protein